MVIPGRGWCTVYSDRGILSSYGLLGPLSEGDYLRQLLVTISVSGTQAGRFAATIGPSDQATLQSFEAGMPLIQRSNVVSGIVPCLYWDATAEGPLWFRIPVGIVGSVGSRFVVFHWNTLHAEVFATINVGAEVLRFKKGPKEVPGG